MDWLEKMNQAMDYIEEHLTESISYERAAQLACCSKYHFLRMFPYLTGFTLSEYIRRRRLTLAAFELQTTDIKIIDAAAKYGYDSPEAFSRAFKKQHGKSPVQTAESKKTGSAMVSFPRISFQNFSIKGEKEMKYRIISRESFRVFGVYTEISSDMTEAFKQVPQFARQCDADGTVDNINRLLGRFCDNYTISALYDHTENTFKYMLCNFLPPNLTLPENFTVLTVPAATWAVFDVPDNMQEIWPRIFTEWFPDSGYELEKGVQFEMYYGLARHENAHGEIWLPVRQRK